MEKLTNVKALELVLSMEEVKANAELVEKLNKMKDQFEKKNKSATKDGKKVLTAEQKKNELIKENILEILGTCENPIQIKELMTMEGMEEYSNQKLSALLKQLVESGKVEKIIEKRISKFKLV